ncbi:3',5'-cyclic-AMP phosphodiesterase [Dasania sp. GY-MA-18]|uniref:3',5'-cyclic-AMP phosphodiesterase n=1 Tax=Dasania phycosphaerae TaxID=2950436 RepID=A0A9J6RKM1_9GAMM|nr:MULTISPECIES: 3',5'-cyclic-AMP phosphodiesterase [Dasania]MCR8922453.1 3',5'-cyclic-AMP phosphodiesterase [Dasania sp. GY-MA-18]MCZ0864881.1 3',5'-cyclic-AMP phosphodiesterase [Dasania phycosphaerae]MCZ0868609.1 3',5'-cyclic-AMP phosphodiesterase [Dasania phycosphaerae]
MAATTHSAAALRVLQITDSHLGEQAGERLLNLDTDQSLAAVIDLIAQEQSGCDLLLATGDIANHASVAAYQRFQKLTQYIAPETLWLPGNHDDPELMAQALGQPLVKSATFGNWLIIMLDSTARGQVGGSFTEQELSYLQQQLNEAADHHVLICLHHHPVDIGCAWLDEQRVSNAADFFKLVDGCPQVRGIVWGHVHQQLDTQRKGVQLMSTPSSCVQFAPASERFKLDRLNPGYRWLDLHADGRISTGISRVTLSFDIHYDNADGY